MRNLRSKARLLCLGVVSMLLSACDSRDDYFLEHGDPPVVEFSSAKDTLGSDFWADKNYRVIDVAWGKPDTLFLNVTEPYGKEWSADVEMVTSIGFSGDENAKDEEYLYLFGEEPFREIFNDDFFHMTHIGGGALNIDVQGGNIVFSLNKPAIETLVEDILKVYVKANNSNRDIVDFYNGTYKTYIPLSKEYKVRYAIKVKNKIGTTETKYVELRIKGNTQPTADFSFNVDSENNEVTIKAKCTDKDGHRIVKYSYLFDQEPYRVMAKQKKITCSTNLEALPSFLYYDILMDSHGRIDNQANCFYEFTFGCRKWELENKDKDVDFIEPTTRSEVSHIFQTKGEHTISVRCQDEMGLWSDYVTRKIYIE